MSSKKIILTPTRKRHIQAFKEFSERDSTGQYGECGSQKWSEKLSEHLNLMDANVEQCNIRFWIKRHKWITEPYSDEAVLTSNGKRRNQRQSHTSTALSQNNVPLSAAGTSASDPGSFKYVFLQLQNKITDGTTQNQATRSPVNEIAPPPPPASPAGSIQFETAEGSDIQIIDSFSQSDMKFPGTFEFVAKYENDYSDLDDDESMYSTEASKPDVKYENDDESLDMDNFEYVDVEPDHMSPFNGFDSVFSPENKETTTSIIDTPEYSDEPYIFELVPIHEEKLDFQNHTESVPVNQIKQDLGTNEPTDEPDEFCNSRYSPYSRFDGLQKNRVVLQALGHCAELNQIFGSNSFREERASCLPHLGGIAIECMNTLYGPDVFKRLHKPIDELDASYIEEIDLTEED